MGQAIPLDAIATVELTACLPRNAEPVLVRDLIRPMMRIGCEQTVLVGLDSQSRLRCALRDSAGQRFSTGWPVASLRELASDALTTTVWLAHNHPSGSARPSADDVAATRRLAHWLALVNMVLHDHVILTDHGLFSFRRANLL